MAVPTGRRVLVFQTAYIGDVILAVPLLRALRQNLKPARLGLVARPGLKKLFESLQIVDEVLEVDKKDPVSRKALMAQMRNFRADVAISPHRSFRTAWWVFRSKAKIRVGFSDPWSFFAYTHRVPRPPHEHDVLRQMELLTAFGIQVSSQVRGRVSTNSGDQSNDVSLSTPFSDNMPLPIELGFATIREAKASSFRPVVIAPGSQWKTKQWTVEGFIQTAQHFVKSGRQIVLAGTASEKNLCEEIAQKVPVQNICGKTSLEELAALLSLAEVVICNDSGVLHVASLAGAPVVAVFGPTATAQGYAPWNLQGRVAEMDLSCRPCGAHGHQHCPIGTHECMRKVSSSMVIGLAQDLISGVDR